MLKNLSKIFNNKSGSVLTAVIVIGAALFMVSMMLLTTVSNTTNINKKVDNSENAYLAARSGITMLKDAGADSSFAQKLIDSMGNSTPIEMDLGDLGTCKVKITDAGESSDGSGVITKRAKVECTGVYEGSEFTLTRYLKFQQTGSVSNNELNTCAYLHYGDGDMLIDGGIEGNVIIIGDGNITNEKANSEHPMYDVVCSNELELTNSGSVYDLIATGKHLVLGAVTVNNEIYVGANERDSDDKDSGVLNDDIYCYLDTATVGGAVRCEGVTILSGSAEINNTNASATGGVVNSSQNAVISGGDLYVGYSASNPSSYRSGDSYKNDASTVNTAQGLSKNNAGQNIYGGLVSGGDIKIASSSNIYGDIICKGNLTISSNCAIYGKIYAGGDVLFESSMNEALNQAFPEVDKRVIYAGGTVTMNSPNIRTSSFGTIYENASPVPNHSLYFNGSDFVGAADYFCTQYESSPKPTTKIPERLYNLLETAQTESSVQMVTETCWYCTDANYCPLDMTQTCDWCSYYDGSPYWTAADQWGNRDHIRHQGKPKHAVHQKATTDPPTYQTVETDTKQMHITSDTRLVGDISLTSSEYKLYIDCSPQAGETDGRNIDILLEGNIAVNMGGGIYVNDNGGQNQVRIFMTEGSSITLPSAYGPDNKGIYVVSDDAADTSIESLPTDPNSSVYDISKVPQLYLFGEEGKNNITLDVGTYGYIPGYVLMPYIDVKTDSNAHCYVSGTPVGYNPDNWSEKQSNNYPFFFGMLMCNSLEFHQGTNTFVKYNWDLDSDDPNEKSDTRKMFDSALARDSVMTFASSNNVVGDSDSSTNLAWVVTGCE